MSYNLHRFNPKTDILGDLIFVDFLYDADIIVFYNTIDDSIDVIDAGTDVYFNSFLINLFENYCDENMYKLFFPDDGENSLYCEFSIDNMMDDRKNKELIIDFFLHFYYWNSDENTYKLDKYFDSNGYGDIAEVKYIKKIKSKIDRLKLYLDNNTLPHTNPNKCPKILNFDKTHNFIDSIKEYKTLNIGENLYRYDDIVYFYKENYTEFDVSSQYLFFCDLKENKIKYGMPDDIYIEFLPILERFDIIQTKENFMYFEYSLDLEVFIEENLDKPVNLLFNNKMLTFCISVCEDNWSIYDNNSASELGEYLTQKELNKLKIVNTRLIMNNFPEKLKKKLNLVDA